MSSILENRIREGQTATVVDHQEGESRTIGKIEQAVGNIGEVLGDIVRDARTKSQRESLRTQLAGAIARLKESPLLEKIGDRPVSLYWKHNSVCGPALGARTIRDYASCSADELLAMKRIGRVRLFALVDALNYAVSGDFSVCPGTPAPVCVSDPVGSPSEWIPRLPEKIKEEVKDLFTMETISSGTLHPTQRVLHQLFRVIGHESLVLMWMSRNVFHRRVAETLGVTESRVSQILKDKNAQFNVVLATEMPDMVERWRYLLSQPAVDEDVLLSPWFNYGLSSAVRHEIGGFFLTVFGAKHPDILTKCIDECWCFDPDALKTLAKEVAVIFPASDSEVKNWLSARAPDTSIPALKAALGRTMAYVASHGMWFAERKTAVDFILKQAGRPLTRTEIASALGVKVSQTKALLLAHPGIERIGPNLKRTYVLKEDL